MNLTKTGVYPPFQCRTMNKKTFSFHYESYSNRNDLPGNLIPLVNAAEEAAGHAYAPYSGFRVGAAVMLENGKIITGNNQENAAYPSGLCAERVALFTAHANNPGEKIMALAVYTLTSKGEHPAMPCGACRQVITEYEELSDKPMTIIAACNHGPLLLFRSGANLLPLTFTRKHLV